MCGVAAENGQAVFSRDIRADVRCTLMECKEAGIISFAALPVKQDSEMLGVIGIASKTERDFSRQRDFLETIAGTVALCAHNALLHESLMRYSNTLENSVQERTAELEKKNTELERLNNLFIDREFRIKELRDKVKELEKEI